MKAHSLPEKGINPKAHSLPEKGTKLNLKAHSLPEKGTKRYLLAKLKGLCIIYPSGTAEAMPKFLAMSFGHAYRYLLTIVRKHPIVNKNSKLKFLHACTKWDPM